MVDYMELPHLSFFPKSYPCRDELIQKTEAILFIVSCLICLFIGLSIGMACGLFLAPASH